MYGGLRCEAKAKLNILAREEEAHGYRAGVRRRKLDSQFNTNTIR